MTEQPKNDNAELAERAVETRLAPLTKRHTFGALADGMMAFWLKIMRRLAGPAEIATVLRQLAVPLEEESTPGRAAEPNTPPENPDDIVGAALVADETAALMRLRGFSDATIADAFFASGATRAERALGRARTLETLELLTERYRLGDTRAH